MVPTLGDSPILYGTYTQLVCWIFVSPSLMVIKECSSSKEQTGKLSQDIEEIIKLMKNIQIQLRNLSS